jgi:hypothetical protein
MECPLNKERPSAGSSWLLLAMPVTVLLFWLWIWLVWLLDGMVWFGVERWQGRKDILVAFITLGSVVARPQLSHKTHLLLVDMPHWTASTSFCWIAAQIYFVWSPKLMRLGLVVCGVGGWIPTFTRAPNPRTSSGAHREGLIQTFDEGKPVREPHLHTVYPLLGFNQLAGGVDNNSNLQQHLFISMDVGDSEHAGVDTLQQIPTALFQIPRPWEKDAPTFASEQANDLLDFLENVDTIIELGHVEDEQARKALLTSYLPVTKRLLWREMKTYTAEHSFADFQTEVRCLHPEIAERERGSLEGLHELCKSFGVPSNFKVSSTIVCNIISELTKAALPKESVVRVS